MPKAITAAALGFAAISCLTGWGEWGGWLNAELCAAFGRGRYLLAGMLAWLVWIIIARKRQLLIWAYAAAASLLVCASLGVAQRGAYGYAIARAAAGITQRVGAEGLYVVTASICAAPFIRRRRRGLSGGLKGLQGFYANTVMPELEGFKLFVDGGAGDVNDNGGWACQASEPAAQALQGMLGANKVKAAVTGAIDGLTALQLIIRPEPGVHIAQIERLIPEIAMELNTSPHNVTVTAENRRVVVSVNKEGRRVAEFKDLIKDRAFMLDKELIPVGITQNGQPHYAALNTDMPHLLVAGATRSGKTAFLQALIVSMVLKYRPGELAVMLVAGTSDGFAPFRELPHLAGSVLYDMDEIEQGLSAAVQEMEKRARIRRADTRAAFHRLVVVIDELDGIVGRSEKGVYGAPARLITRLAKESGKYGISLILGTQKPTGDVIPADVLSCINARVCLQVATAKFSRQVIDAPSAAQLSGKGDLYYSNGGQLIRCQGYYLAPEEIKRIVGRFAGDYEKPCLVLNGPAPKPSVCRCPALPMETRETDRHPTPIQYNKKSAPPDGNRRETRVETETWKTADAPRVGVMEGGPAETDGYTPADIIRMYNTERFTMREIAKKIGRSPKYVHTVLHRRDGSNNFAV